MSLRAPLEHISSWQTYLHGNKQPISAQGRRCSQGGQSLLDGAVALDLDLLQSAEVSEEMPEPCARIQAGALWNHLHQMLARHEGRRFAPRVHQSSPWFSVGGSLAVNCHGRDPRQPPIAGTVRAMALGLANGEVIEVRPGDALFHGVLGGFGACATILSATIALQPEHNLRRQVRVLPMADHVAQLAQRIHQKQPWPDLHHAFCAFDRDGSLFEEVISVDAWQAGAVKPEEPLAIESFLATESGAALYELMRAHPDHRAFWETMKLQQLATDGECERTLNAMRAAVRFTYLEEPETSDFLQEYFLPVEHLAQFLDSAREVLLKTPDSVKLLSATLRVVQQDRTALLSYCAEGPRVSVVLNMNAPKVDLVEPNLASAQSKVSQWTQHLIDTALQLQGSFYMPYGRHATPGQVRQAYPGWKELAQLRRHFDPGHRFDNRFLQAYRL